MLGNFKEKSWSVFLVKGYMANDQVRALRCENCKSKTEVLATNHHNPHLFLYGCKENKCKHRLLRLDFDASCPFHETEPPTEAYPIESPEISS